MSEDITPRMPQDDRIDRLFNLVQSMMSEIQDMKRRLESLEAKEDARARETKGRLDQIYAVVAATSNEFRELERRHAHEQLKRINIEERIGRLEERINYLEGREH